MYIKPVQMDSTWPCPKKPRIHLQPQFNFKKGKHTTPAGIPKGEGVAPVGVPKSEDISPSKTPPSAPIYPTFPEQDNLPAAAKLLPKSLMCPLQEVTAGGNSVFWGYVSFTMGNL
jgi:hypothetical protein